MKQYIETENNSYTFEGMSIPASEGNRHYQQMLVEVEAGEAEIIPFDFEAKAVEDLKASERSWRNEELNRADIELNKVQDGMGINSVSAWRSYRNALRDYPAQQDFPNGERPVAPDTI